MKAELIKLYNEFCAYVVEATPNYTDADFSFENFVAYLQIEETKGDSAAINPIDIFKSEIAPIINRLGLDIMADMQCNEIAGFLAERLESLISAPRYTKVTK